MNLCNYIHSISSEYRILCSWSQFSHSSCWLNMVPFMCVPCGMMLGQQHLLSLTWDLELTFHAAICHNAVISPSYDNLHCFDYNSREVGVNPFFCLHVVQLIIHIWILVSITSNLFHNSMSSLMCDWKEDTFLSCKQHTCFSVM